MKSFRPIICLFVYNSIHEIFSVYFLFGRCGRTDILPKSPGPVVNLIIIIIIIIVRTRKEGTVKKEVTDKVDPQGIPERVKVTRETRESQNAET